MRRPKHTTPRAPDALIPKRVLLLDYDARRFAIWRARARPAATEAHALGLFIKSALDDLERASGVDFLPGERTPE